MAKNWRDYGIAVGKPSWQSSGILNNANQRSLPVWHCIKKYATKCTKTHTTLATTMLAVSMALCVALYTLLVGLAYTTPKALLVG